MRAIGDSTIVVRGPQIGEHMIFLPSAGQKVSQHEITASLREAIPTLSTSEALSIVEAIDHEEGVGQGDGYLTIKNNSSINNFRNLVELRLCTFSDEAYDKRTCRWSDISAVEQTLRQKLIDPHLVDEEPLTTSELAQKIVQRAKFLGHEPKLLGNEITLHEAHQIAVAVQQEEDSIDGLFTPRSSDAASKAQLRDLITARLPMYAGNENIITALSAALDPSIALYIPNENQIEDSDLPPLYVGATMVMPTDTEGLLQLITVLQAQGGRTAAISLGGLRSMLIGSTEALARAPREFFYALGQALVYARRIHPDQAFASFVTATSYRISTLLPSTSYGSITQPKLLARLVSLSALTLRAEITNIMLRGQAVTPIVLINAQQVNQQVANSTGIPLARAAVLVTGAFIFGFGIGATVCYFNRDDE